MTIGNYSTSMRGKRVVDFSMGDQATDQDVVYRLVQGYEAEESQTELFEHFLTQVDASKLEALVIGPWNESQEEGPDGYLEALIEHRADLINLKALFVGDMTYEDCEMSWIIQTSYNPLLTAYPRLESLRIRGTSNLEIEAFEHAGLLSLAIESGGLPMSIVDAIAESKLPALNHLELWLGDENYGYDGSLADFQRLMKAINPQRLRYLGLRNAPNTDEFATWLAGQSWLAGLDTLDLSLGTIGDVGAQALCASPYVSGLKRLDLSHHYVGEQWQSKLSLLPTTVVLDDPEEEDDGERYVAVSE